MQMTNVNLSRKLLVILNVWIHEVQINYAKWVMYICRRRQKVLHRKKLHLNLKIKFKAELNLPRKPIKKSLLLSFLYFLQGY